MTFNPAELTTDQQARSLRGFINNYGPFLPERIGGGVLQGDGFTNRSIMDQAGIFLPSWTPGPGGFPEPNGTDPLTGQPTYWLSFRFLNGLTSNVGLMWRGLFVINTTPLARRAQMAYWMTYFGT